ncbi:facilitated trehalose transporter Tret1-like [Musca vetustissima]|uniref:facilitated trehalose transporter Tret1-like n=1 Tax=Musca vetustissima TaxID=27455 RepID=UPI002AB75DF4|nr:facilitated trehalose transporter Tret1-like [Musca vetustissima]
MQSNKTGRIFLAAIAANLSAFSVGTCLGWTSPVGAVLKSPDTSGSPLDYRIDANEDAWISSILALGALAAPFAAGPLADKIGRKWSLISSSIFLVAAFVLMMLAHNVGLLLLGRFLQGFGAGFVMTITPMYVGEISPDNVRGATGSLMQLFLVAGILYVYSIGPYVSYQALQWCCLIIPLLFDAVFFFMPESPYYLAGRGRKVDALKSLKFLRGQNSADNVKEEMCGIQKIVEESMSSKASFKDLLTNIGNRKALIITAGLVAFQQLSGINVVLFNAQSIFQSAGTDLDPAIATIITGAVQVLSSGLTPILADRLGRKIILLISAAGMCMGLTALGTFFYMQLEEGDVSRVLWLPVPALVIYNIVYCIGFGPLPWAVAGEMFPPNVKSKAASIGTSTCWTLGFLVAYSYPSLAQLGPHYAFWLFAVFCAVAFAFTLFVVMETKGLSLQQIQDQLNGRQGEGEQGGQ